MGIKHKGVEGGTIGGVPICRTCRWAQYIRGASVGQEALHCARIEHGPNGMPFEAYECSQYSDKRRPSLETMNETAWILRTDEFRKAIGFVSPGEWTKIWRTGKSHPWEEK